MLTLFNLFRRLIGIQSFALTIALSSGDGVGSGQFNRSGEAEHVPMTPVVTFIGDNNNILSMWNLEEMDFEKRIDARGQTLKQMCHQLKYTYKPIQSCIDYFCEIGIILTEEEIWTKTDYHDYVQGLKSCAAGDNLKANLIKYMFKSEHLSLRFLNGVTEKESNNAEEKTGGKDMPSGDSDDENGTSLFHLDREGKVRFTKREAKWATTYLENIDLDGKAKAQLQRKGSSFLRRARMFRYRTATRITMAK